MKKLMLICAPVTSRSGYGDHARDLVWSFIEHDKYDIKIMDVRWGDTPRTALKLDTDYNKKIQNCIMPEPKLDRQPDIYVDIRIPNEFETHGKFNIGITAGIETTAVSQNWLECCNKMDLVIVPSEHSKTGFVNTIYDKVQNTQDGQQQKVGELKLEKPIEVLFEGSDEDVYKPLEKDNIDSGVYKLIEDIVPEKFAFLFVGLWGKGNYGEDRKDVSKLIKIFYESFANKQKQPALILKTNGASFSILDKEDCLTKLNELKSHFPSDWKLPNVYLLHGEFTDSEMNSLYNHPKIKCMVSITHGEGYGRPLQEATMTGLPVLASEWSGQLDFLDNEQSILIRGELDNVPESQHWENIIIPESQWFNVDENDLYKKLNYVFENKYEIKNKAKGLMYNNREKFTLNKMVQKLDEIMKQYTKDLPQQVSIKLPKLKKSTPQLEETV
jgi:glycosyltransferase involved in cell wall biosynthesis